ncbi:MAG: glycosyltransferase family 2 protein [Armatimonadetes bacterium]|nr:glycosyltransferase family 2 protein [Armatimonadota bacterium]
MGQVQDSDITIIVPALDEQATIREVVDRLLALPVSAQVVVVDDGSTDDTPSILASYGNRITVVTNPSPSGKGMAIRKGLAFATGKVVVIQDADLEYSPEEIPKLAEPILAGLYGVVYGTRFSNGMHKDMALPNRAVNVLLRWAVRILYGRKITDEATCYKAFRRGLLEEMELECERFEFCPEVTAKAILMGEHIHEEPIQYQPRSRAAGKKIRWTDAPEAFWTLLKYRFWRPH